MCFTNSAEMLNKFKIRNVVINYIQETTYSSIDPWDEYSVVLVQIILAIVVLLDLHRWPKSYRSNRHFLEVNLFPHTTFMDS